MKQSTGSSTRTYITVVELYVCLCSQVSFVCLLAGKTTNEVFRTKFCSIFQAFSWTFASCFELFSCVKIYLHLARGSNTHILHMRRFLRTARYYSTSSYGLGCRLWINVDKYSLMSSIGFQPLPPWQQLNPKFDGKKKLAIEVIGGQPCKEALKSTALLSLDNEQHINCYHSNKVLLSRKIK